MTKNGERLGYGRGFYDKYLAGRDLTSIALTYSKLMVKNIPHSETDIPIEWVVTEDGVIES